MLAALVALIDRVTDSGPSAAVVSAVNAPPVTDDTVPFLKPSTVLTTVPSILVRHQVEAEATAQPVAVAEEEVVVEAEAATVIEEPQPQPAFFTYTVQPGDTVSSIAAAFGIEPDYIMWNNPEMSADPDLLLVGANVLVPSVNGLVYHVTLGDTLSDIASYYQIDVQNVVGFLPNDIASPDAVTEGMVLVLPGGVPPPPPIPEAVEVVESTAPRREHRAAAAARARSGRPCLAGGHRLRLALLRQHNYILRRAPSDRLPQGNRYRWFRQLGRPNRRCG
jgi:LysM repeat protein